LRKFFVATLAIAALVAFAGTCTITHISLTTIGSNDTFAGELHNDSGVNILQHNVLVAFLNSSGSVLETKTVQPCLRTLPTGGANYFSAKSSFSSSSTTVGLARIVFDSTFKVGTAETGSGTISNLAVNRNEGTLIVSGTFKNTDSSTLEAPNACAVVYSSSGNVIIVGLDQTMADLATNASDTFSITMTVPDSTSTVDHVNVYVDGLKDGVPTLPVATDLSNSVNLTPTATATPVGTPGAAVQLKFLTTIGTATHDTSFGSVKVAIQDANGLTVTSSTASVTLSIEGGTGTAGAVLSCTTSTLTIAAVSGVATFTPCSIDTGGLQYHLKAESAGLSTDISDGFNVTPGALDHITFTQDPSSGVVSTAFGTQPKVTLFDADGAVLFNNSSSSVTLSITGSPAGVTLACTGGLSATVSGGVASFSGCNINKHGTAYTLHAVVSAKTADSAAFDIVGKLVFSQQPSGTAASGVDFATQPKVKYVEGDGTTAITDSDTRTVALTLSAGGTLNCDDLTVQLSSGVATFTGCDITTAGTYHLIANIDTTPQPPAVNSTNIVVS
jgi:hypothetical protein